MGWLNKLISKPLTQDGLAQEVQTYLQGKLPETEISYDKEEFCLLLDINSTRYQFYLGNLFNECKDKNAAERLELIDFFSQGLLSPDKPADYAAVKPNLMLHVRSKAYLNNIAKLQLEAEEYDPAYSVFNTCVSYPGSCLPPHLFAEVVYDTEHSIMGVDKTDLEEWQVTADTVTQAAYDNFCRISREPKFDEIRAGLYISRDNDRYCSSRLLFPELFRSLAVNGQPVVLPVERDTVYVTGSLDEECLQDLGYFLLENYGEFRMESLLPLVLTDNNTWQEFAIAKSASYYNVFQRLKVYELNTDYAEQKEYLELLLKDQNIFIASYQAYANAEINDIHSAASWTKDVVTLLPQTDTIAFVDTDADDEVFVVDWNQAYPVIAHYLTPTDYAPVRYLVQQYPTEDEIAELKKLEKF